MARLSRRKVVAALGSAPLFADGKFTAATAADPALDPRDRVAASLDAMEAALTLDVLTAGWFVARVAALEPLAPSPP